MEMLAKVDAANGSAAAAASRKNSQSPETQSPIAATAAAQQASPAAATLTSQNTTSSKKAPSIHEDDEEAYVVAQVNQLAPNGTYKGPSTGNAFVDALVEKLKLRQSPVSSLVAKLFETMDSYPTPGPSQAASPHPTSGVGSAFESVPTPASSVASPISPVPKHYATPSFFAGLTIPNRMSTDKLTTTYFHEWNSMIAVLDQYDFLEQYQSVMNALATAENTGFYDIPGLRNQESFIVTVQLVLALGALASKDKTPAAIAEATKLTADWKRSFTPQLQAQPSLQTVQALLLAWLCSLHLGNMDDVWYYRMQAVSMAQRLGLHRSHQSLRLANNAQMPFAQQEMRRRLFWATYTLDCFAAAQLGAPRLLNDADVECPLPLDIDDLQEGSQPQQQPAEGSAMSCPLAVIGFAKCLARILDTMYSCTIKSHPYKTLVMLEDQVESWRRELIPVLKFDFVNGDPAVTLAPVHQKSPLLLMFYHYAKVLIHMPAVTSPASTTAASPGSNASTRGSASCVAVLQSAKVLLQLQNYLKARNVIPTIPINPALATVLFTTLVLYGAIDYSKGGALLLDIRNVVSAGMSYLYTDIQTQRPGCLASDMFPWFEEICDTLLNVSNKKAGDDDKRKRRTSTKRRESAQSPAAAGPTTTTNSKTLARQQPTPPPTGEHQDTDALRYSAINDLLYLSTYASQKQQLQQQSQHSQHKAIHIKQESPEIRSGLSALFNGASATSTGAGLPLSPQSGPHTASTSPRLGSYSGSVSGSGCGSIAGSPPFLDSLMMPSYSNASAVGHQMVRPPSATAHRSTHDLHSEHSVGEYKSELLNFLDSGNNGSGAGSWADPLTWH